eukprot:COSAG01_NODE_5013_length_4542_cov_5.457799_5_plen_118_part_00
MWCTRGLQQQPLQRFQLLLQPPDRSLRGSSSSSSSSIAPLRRRRRCRLELQQEPLQLLQLLLEPLGAPPTGIPQRRAPGSPDSGAPQPLSPLPRTAHRRATPTPTPRQTPPRRHGMS